MKFQSILLICNKTLTLEELNFFVQNNTELKEELNELNTLTISSEKNTIGIAQLEEIQQWISLRSSKLKFVLIKSAERLTPEAQNSLLKNLEEPPENTQFILITKNSTQILETIRSRCIELRVSGKYESNADYKSFATKFIGANYLERLKMTELLIKEYESREEISEVVFEIIRNLPFDKNYSEKSKVLKNIYIGIKSSVNLKLCLDLLAISLE